jgi:molybdate transport system substrate-binding protein
MSFLRHLTTRLKLTLGGSYLHSIKKIFFVALTFTISATQAAEINVYAAASLTDVLTEITSAYKKIQPSTSVKTSFAGAQTLAKQIEHGAPADLFISADLEWADYLAKRNLLKNESRKNLLNNSLVFITPQHSTLQIEMNVQTQLTAQFSGKLCTGDPAYVPVGKYAKQALEYYNWWNSVQNRVVGTEDVRTSLALVERGECDLGIVYATDANASKKVKVVAQFPESSHKPIIYPGALTQTANKDAEQFWQFLQSDPAKQIFQQYGFGVLE